MASKQEADGLLAVSSQPYAHQAQFFLNAFWGEYQTEAEACWKFVHGFQKLDNVKGKEGNELDEFWSHKFLETHGDTMTAIQMRNALKEIDIDCNKRMSFIEYALWKYKQTVKELLSRPQGDNSGEIAKAQAMLAAVQKALELSERRAEEAKTALREAETREADAKRSEAEAAAAKAELEVALAEVNAQQQAYDNTTADLKAKSEQGGQVAQNKAKAELAAHLNKPTLALTRAKITAEAAVKRAEKTKVAATEARHAASASRTAAEKAKQAAEAAVEDARRQVDEAEAFLQEVKSRPGGGQGAIWWMERELHEARAYLPERKGGYKKDK